jgi:hypothetical protein
MSLETWLLIAVIVLLIAFFGVSIFLFYVLFSRMSSLPFDAAAYFASRSEGWRQFVAPEFRRLAYMIRQEEDRFSLRLTEAARQMLIIPIEEQISDRGGVDWSQLDETFRKLFEALRRDDAESSRSSRGSLNSVGVIKAFHARFCNIPPFCAPTERGSEDDR